MSGIPGMNQRHRSGLDARQRAWNAMRILRRFDAGTLEATAEIGPNNLREFIRALHRAGYLRLERPKQNGKALGHALWQLIRASGPRAPIVRTDGSGVWDPNQGAFHPADGSHDRPAERPGTGRRVVRDPA